MATPQEQEWYFRHYIWPENDLLNELERYTYQTTVNPRMIVGRTQGRLLQLLVQLQKPEYILEIGCFTGYSTIAMAEAAPNTTKLITIDVDDEVMETAKRFAQKAGVNNKIKFLTGKAQDILPDFPDNQFDFIFIDGEKSEYPDYYRLVFDKWKPGGLLLIDNILWNGKVFDKAALASDRKTQAVVELTNIIQNDQRVRNFILPLRDGLMIVEKIST